MARLIRARDWAATPLGPLAAWPQSLRSALGLCLGARIPLGVYWGERLLLLYNDAFRELIGDRHPRALGRPAAEVFPEIWPWIGPMFRGVLATGEGGAATEALLPLLRQGQLEDRWFDFSFNPIPGEDGRVHGVLNIATESTARVLAERRLAFLLRVSDALRPLADPLEVQGEACRLLAEHLDVERAYHVELDEAAGLARVGRDHVREGGVSLAGEHRVADFGWSVEILRRGDCHVVSDARTSPLVPEADRSALASLGIVACMGVPLLKEGRLLGALCVTDPRPRSWTPRETDLLREAGERIWEAVQRARAKAGLRETEARFRQFGDASADMLWIRDAASLAFEYVSPAFEEIYGARLDHVLGGRHLRRWAETVVPEDRGRTLDALRRVRAGEHVLHAFRILRADGQVRWIRNTDFPLTDEAGRVQRIGGIAHDATEEVELRERERALLAELQHRTRNLLGVVRSLADRTIAGSASLEDFRGRFRDRLGALARVNGLLSRLEEGRRITFDQLLQAELSAHGLVDAEGKGPQVRLGGPRGIRLRSATVQTLALGLHELATNALKHGALSRPEGRLAVAWALVPGPSGERRLRVDWRESGLAPLDGPEEGNVTPMRRRGYGRELIERALPYQLQAETSYDLAPDGVRCTITLPVSSTMDGNGPSRDGAEA